MTKKENVLEKCRINLDNEKTQHSITRIQRDKYKQALLKCKKYLENDLAWNGYQETEDILKIVNKALGDGSNENK